VQGVRFHRIVRGFCCQGGDVVKRDGSAGESIYGGKFNDEKAGIAMKHGRAGLLSMANSGKNSNSSQFFFTLAPAPQCDGKHVVFGQVRRVLHVAGVQRRACDSIAHCHAWRHQASLPQVIEGYEVVKAIESVGSSSGATAFDVIVGSCGELSKGSSTG